MTDGFTIKECPDCSDGSDECHVVGCPNYSGPRVTINVLEGEMNDLSDTESFQIECLECESLACGGPEDDVEWYKEYHRDHYCAGADFEVVR